MKNKLLGMLLTSGMIVTVLLSGQSEFVYAENVGNMSNVGIEENGLQVNSYIESDLDNNTPVYDPDIAVYSEVPSAFPGSVSAVTSKYPAYRNQNPYGTCWAFASTGLAEFDLINDGSADKNIDLSELALAYFTYNSVTDPLGGMVGDYTKYYNENASVSYLNYGGNFEMASRRYAQWVGPVNESLVPYSQASGSVSNGLDDSYAYGYDEAHLQNAYLINIKKNADDVKKQIMEHGAVGIMYYHDDYSLGWNDSIASYTYHDDDYSGGGHAVMVVGWDDNFSKDNFTAASKPENDGAWLIRNSWGIYASYFWMSYETCSLADTAWVFDFSVNDGLDNNYQLDGGVTAYPDKNHRMLANVFTAQEKSDNEYEELKAVSLSFTTATSVNYTIDVYTDLQNESDPISGTKQESATTTGTTAYAGIYTIPLENSVKLTPGSKFAIVVSLDSAVLDYEQATSISNEDFTKTIWDCAISIGNNKSFYYSGSRYYPFYWGNYSIKAFTSNEEKMTESQNQLTAKGYSMSLTDTIGANLYAALSSDILDDAGAKVRFTYPDSSYSEKLLSDFGTTDYNGDIVKVIKYEVVPAKLTEQVDISVVKSDGTQSNSFAFSPSDYLNNLIKKDTGNSQKDTLVKNVAEALLNYAAYSQLYFGINTSELANRELENNAVENLTVTDILNCTVGENTVSLNNTDLEYMGSSIVCTGGTGLKLYFKNKNSLSLEQIQQKYLINVSNDNSDQNSNEYEAMLNDNMLCIKIKNLYPYQLSKNFTITIKSSNETLQGSVSPFSYMRKAAQGNNLKLQNLCKAMYLYGSAVDKLVE